MRRNEIVIRRARWLGLGAAAGVASIAVAQHAYTLTDLGSFGRPEVSVANAVSDRGEVVGLATTGGVSVAAFSWRAGEMTRLPGHPLLSGSADNEAWDVNESGQIAARLGNLSTYFAARIEADRTVLDLGALPDGHVSAAYGINEAGDVVGWSDSETRVRPFVYREAVGHMAELPLPRDAALQLIHEARAINDAGLVVGVTSLNGGKVQERAIVWGPDDQVIRVIDGLGALLKRSYGHDINNRNQVVGWAELDSEDWVGFMHDLNSGETLRLGSLGGPIHIAHAINDLGQIVGVGSADIFSRMACIWDDGAVTDLNTLLPPATQMSYDVYEAHDINSMGQIAAYALRRSDHAVRAVLLTPAATCRADLDGDGELTFFDFLAFQNLFAAGDLKADFDNSGVLDFFDFLAFQSQFVAACP